MAYISLPLPTISTKIQYEGIKSTLLVVDFAEYLNHEGRSH